VSDAASPRPPSVDSVARSISDIELPHSLLVDVARVAIANGDSTLARTYANEMVSALLKPVINATGVLLHTNLGRAPLSGVMPNGYTNLEFDLVAGGRGDRRTHAAKLIARLVGAESAVVVNNGASAIMLALSALANGRRVVVSRGELVEIGGGFRIPDVLASSGARLVEVGTTNKTRLKDYSKACRDDTAMLLKVHQSNYRVVGFTESVGVSELASLGPPVVYDIGSGLIDSTTPWLAAGPPAWLVSEPAARQSLGAGAALVTFSGDKLFGGPQAGVIAGRADLVDLCAQHPLYRALRPGAMVLQALQSTSLAYLARDASKIPFWRLATEPVESLRARAVALGVGDVIDSVALAGGGTLPGFEIPSVAIAMRGDYTEELRRSSRPIIARVREGMTTVDLRTVEAYDDATLGQALRTLGAPTSTH
jgi:L-seryl-tRNA(Ser) seleniumtransferase